MSDFKTKMHPIRFQLGLCPRPRWGRLQRSPRGRGLWKVWSLGPTRSVCNVCLQRLFRLSTSCSVSETFRVRSAKSEIAPKKHFDREYLRNGTIYRQSENGVADYDLSRVRWHNLVNFGPQTKNRTVVWSLHNAKFVFYPKVGVPKLL